MTSELIQRLMAAGLSKQQASSATAETLVNLFMPDDGRMLIAEAQRQVSAMQKMLNDMRGQYNDLVAKMNTINDAIAAIASARETYGEVTDEKARNAIALYGALLNMNESKGAKGNDSVENASYIMYAYLGGQAKREITYTKE